MATTLPFLDIFSTQLISALVLCWFLLMSKESKIVKGEEKKNKKKINFIESDCIE